jgi:hypothetical protein
MPEEFAVVILGREWGRNIQLAQASDVDKHFTILRIAPKSKG